MEKGQEPHGYELMAAIIIQDGQGLTQGPEGSDLSSHRSKWASV